LEETVKNVIEVVPTWAWPNWVLSTSRNSRSVTRLGSSVNALALIQMTLPGTPVVYYGEEIGMEDAPDTDVAETLSYEPACGDMDWDEVKAQKSSNSSRYTVYKSLVALRKSHSILYGDTKFVEGKFVEGKNIFAFTRIRKGSPGYLVIANFGGEPLSVNLEGQARLPEEMTVEIRTAESSLLGTALK
jgi:glycosidase